MDNYQVVEYLPAYQKQVKDFVTKAHEEFGFPHNSWLDSDLENLDEFYKNKGGVFYIMLNNNTLVGTVAIKKITNEEAELKRLYLNQKYRNQGLGFKLMNLAISFAKTNNFKKITLNTNIKQTKAIELYKRNDFKEDKQEGNVIFMSKDLE